VRELESSYIKTSQSRLQVRIKRFDVRLVRFGVDCCDNKPVDMESGFDEVGIISQGLSNP
jgi:hypothetical protein